VGQIENLLAHYNARTEPQHATVLERIKAMEMFVASAGAVIKHGGNRAFYRMTDDVVQMPERQRSGTVNAIMQSPPMKSPTGLGIRHVLIGVLTRSGLRIPSM
jgi:Zincin-like metallopeptidase